MPSELCCTPNCKACGGALAIGVGQLQQHSRVRAAFSKFAIVPNFTTSLPETTAGQVIAHAKLPDDIQFDEFVEILESLRVISHQARVLAIQDMASRGEFVTTTGPEPGLVRVQYGSDFVAVLQLVGSVGGAAGALGGGFWLLAKALRTLSEARKTNEEARLINEDRLARKDARLRKRDKRKASAKAYMLAAKTERETKRRKQRALAAKERRQALNDILSLDERRRLAEEVGGPHPVQTYIALSTLADYGIVIDVENVD